MRTCNGSAVILTLVLSALPARAQDVRIRLLDLNSPAEIELSAHEGPLRLYAGEHADPLTVLSAGQEARISRTGHQLHVALDGLALFARSLRAEPAGEALFGIKIGVGTDEQAVRRYAGRLLIETDRNGPDLKLVNDIPLEEYVPSVVATEYGFDDLEGSKAMAVLVRTYALAVLGRYGSDYDHVDHTLSQVYRGADAVTPVSRKAARLTEGEVLTHDGALVRAVYFSSSGGHTADNESVWDGRALPYLRGKPDPYGSDSPHARWTSRISRPQLVAELQRAYGGDVDGFLIDERSEDGRVATIALLRSDGSRRTIKANDFRMLVTEHFGARALRSTLFDARRVGEEYIFEGSGFGHGVGLSQWGAHDMAKQGMSYREILAFYYSDAALSNADDTRPSPEVPARVVRAPDEPSSTPAARRRIGW